MGLFISTDYIDVTDPEHRYGAGEDGTYETAHDTVSDLYAALQGRSRLRPWEESMGRCTGKIYVDIPGSPCSLCHRTRDEHIGPIGATVEEPSERYPYGAVICHGHRYQATAQHVGWVFVKRVAQDERESYGHKLTRANTWVRETWVTVHTAPDDVEVKRTPHYARLGG